MKKFIFIFSFLIGSMSMFANDAVSAQDATEALIELDIPVTINAPDETFTLLSILTAEQPLELLQALANALNTVVGVILPDIITLDVLGIPGGITIVTGGLDVSFWDVTLSEAAFNAILGEEGATISLELLAVPVLLKVTLTISVI